MDDENPIARASLRQRLTWWGIDRALPSSAMVLDFTQAYAAWLAAQLPHPESQAGWLARAADVSNRLRRSLGLDRLVPYRPLLNAQVVGILPRAGYTIEKVVYETLPDMWVAAHVYVPAELGAPAPAVLFTPGHWMENGKLEPDIQICCANLALRGFVVLVYDPIGQGERLNDWMEHGHLEPLLVGVSQAGLMVWESMRALDYLLSRPDVDKARVGMTGASGGGLNTFYTSALDARIAVSVPVCFVTTFYQMMTAERDRNWEDGVDLCNQVPEVMAYAEMSDIGGLFAPKPLCLIAARHDWMFPITGTRMVHQRLREIYRFWGAEQDVQLVEVDDEHGYSQPMREAMYGWIMYWLQNKGDGQPSSERRCDLLPAPYPPALTYIAPPDPADLPTLRQRANYPQENPGWCFPSGHSPPCGVAITHLVQRMAAELPTPVLPNETTWPVQRTELLAHTRALLGRMPVGHPLVRDRTYNQVLHKGIFAERVVFESEPGIELPAMFLAPAEWRRYLPVVIYVDEWGKQVGLETGIVEALLRVGLAVLAVDVRGLGETAISDFEAATNALMSDRPLFGQRVWDVLRAVDYLWRRIYIGVQIDKGRIGCLGRGLGGLLCLYAAALDERLTASALWEIPLSYHDLIVERPGFPPSAYLFDALHAGDLPQVMALIAPRALLVADPVDGMRAPLSESACIAKLEWPRHVYAQVAARPEACQVRITPRGTSSSDLAAWLKEQLSVLGSAALPQLE
ncbi:MAG: alpha/beta hydrolase family protein [Anaerolineae bacterium]